MITNETTRADLVQAAARLIPANVLDWGSSAHATSICELITAATGCTDPSLRLSEVWEEITARRDAENRQREASRIALDVLRQHYSAEEAQSFVESVDQSVYTTPREMLAMITDAALRAMEEAA